MAAPSKKFHILPHVTVFLLLASLPVFQAKDFEKGSESEHVQEVKSPSEAAKHPPAKNTPQATRPESLESTQSGKSRDHIYGTLNLRERKKATKDFKHRETVMKKTLQDLLAIYKSSIEPLEIAYRFSDLNKDALLESEIMAKPLILLLGPWSAGKTSMINYLLEIEDAPEKLHTGAEPTTSDFFIIQHGPKYKTVKGMQLVADQKNSFASLEKLGLHFLERLKGIELPSEILELVTIVDTPGILENRKQQERGYPFNEVIQWFLQRSSVIYLVFDPTKMEVGTELENIFNQLKGYDAKIKILLNKADTITQQELMKVYGALFWNLAPIVKSVEPPRVYIGSFWSKAKIDHPMYRLFLEEETALLVDLNQVVENQVENKVAYIRTHAYLVRLHALTVDSFMRTYENHKSLIFNNDKLWQEIVNEPDKFGVFQEVMVNTEMSIHDTPRAETYLHFFRINTLNIFARLKSHCTFFSGCAIDKISAAITKELPQLLAYLKENVSQGHCTKDTC
ncbi:unnamed protein product [Lymnaea stagnalis]|uniref:Dynamin-type G domain-containing protein n=1 Tax=Lymnaea stagnalis TaxID=6523 RepID=A0AAV2HF54_LYMST